MVGLKTALYLAITGVFATGTPTKWTQPMDNAKLIHQIPRKIAPRHDGLANSRVHVPPARRAALLCGAPPSTKARRLALRTCAFGPDCDRFSRARRNRHILLVELGSGTDDETEISIVVVFRYGIDSDLEFCALAHTHNWVTPTAQLQHILSLYLAPVSVFEPRVQRHLSPLGQTLRSALHQSDLQSKEFGFVRLILVPHARWLAHLKLKAAQSFFSREHVASCRRRG